MPDAYIKSAPMTATIAAGNPKAQYGADGSIKAKKRHAVVELRVPVTVREEKTKGKYGNMTEQHGTDQ